MLLERGQRTCAPDTSNATRCLIADVLPIASGDRVFIGFAQGWFRPLREIFQRLRVDLASNDAALFHCVGVDLERRLDLNAAPQQVGLLFPLHDRLPLFGRGCHTDGHDHDEEHQGEISRPMRIAQSGGGEAHIRIG